MLIAAMCLLAACGDDDSSPPPASPPPWQRTETREPCADYDPLRSPYFGDLHVHTRYSADAYIYGTRVDPRAAYDFARGEAIPASDADENQTRTIRIERPLDFAAVTDHSEFLGEVYVCSTPGTPGYDADLCTVLRRAESPEDQVISTARWLFPAGVPNPPPSLEFCFTPGVDCDGALISVWNDIQAAAEEAYDRSAACSFTTFVAYEHTAAPAGRHLHRNVIFRNATVPTIPSSQLETGPEIPQGIWSAIETQCLDTGTGCDAILIPHNPNLSGGDAWHDPADAAEAQRRQKLEPLVELHQSKGNSECRFDRMAGVGVGTADELCTFEQILEISGSPFDPIPEIGDYPRRNLVRNTLKDGLVLEEELGVNPFKLGFIGSTDTHNGTAGNVDEPTMEGTLGNNDATPARQIGRDVRSNSGGLAVVWAEENSRDAIFAALRRRETYATSGTRPIVRFFAGDLGNLACGAPDFVSRGYALGVPMGGDVHLGAGGSAPKFAVWAVKDAGTASQPGADLQRIQIVKGWVDSEGTAQEQVFDVAGSADNGASVDPATCAPRGAGAHELCTIWSDPGFNPAQRAFYYARVLENPTCRWSTYVCKAAGVDPFAANCSAQAAAAGADFASCCSDEDNDSFLSPLIQERAWTSPVWYRPEG